MSWLNVYDLLGLTMPANMAEDILRDIQTADASESANVAAYDALSDNGRA